MGAKNKRQRLYALGRFTRPLWHHPSYFWRGTHAKSHYGTGATSRTWICHPSYWKCYRTWIKKPQPTHRCYRNLGRRFSDSKPSQNPTVHDRKRNRWRRRIAHAVPLFGYSPQPGSWKSRFPFAGEFGYSQLPFATRLYRCWNPLPH